MAARSTVLGKEMFSGYLCHHRNLHRLGDDKAIGMEGCMGFDR